MTTGATLIPEGNSSSKASTAELRLDELKAGELAPLSASIAPGEIICLSGASGSGKSRLLRAIADLDPHQGYACLGHCRADQIAPSQWRARVRLVPAESAWWEETVIDHLLQTPAKAHMDALALDEALLRSPISQLSSGERQRFALLRAIQPSQTACLLLDEPTANLDQATAKKVESWLQVLAKQNAWPVLWIAHDDSQVKRIADRHWTIQDQQVLR